MEGGKNKPGGSYSSQVGAKDGEIESYGMENFDSEQAANVYNIVFHRVRHFPGCDFHRFR